MTTKEEAENFLAHHGVLGMHWGVIRDKAASGNRGAQKKLARADKKWEKDLNSYSSAVKVYNSTARKLNDGRLKKFNDNYHFTRKNPADKAYYDAYNDLYQKTWDESVNEIFGEGSPSGKKTIKINVDPASGQHYLSVIDAEIKHADNSLYIPLKLDPAGLIIGFGDPTNELIHSFYDVDDFLAHHGVLGMHWGVRKDTPTGASPKTDREARKDAEEFTKAKAYYGEGAGTRRKLIKMQVQGKSAKDPEYKKAFEHHVANTDFSKRAEQARGQRHRADVANTTKKTGKGIIHIIRGNPQYASIGAAGVVAGAAFVHKKGYDKMAYNAVKNSSATKAAKVWFSSLV